MRRRKKRSEPKQQISILVTQSDWVLIRDEAARHGMPITKLCLNWWMMPHIEKLRRESKRHENNNHRP